MKRIGLGLVLWGLLSASALAQSAVLLPNGHQQFLDANGAPLAGGSVEMDIPSTSTPKTTWVDPGAAVANINPVPLDSSGEALIYGNGSYRQIVKDALGNTVWDALTAGLVGPFPAYGGVSTGSGNAQVVAASSWTQVGGAQLVFKAGFTNSGAMTLNIGGGSAIFAVVKDGTAGPVALSSGDVQTGNLVLVTYDPIAGNLHMSSVPFALPAVLPIAQGGTGNSTALGARSSGGLNIDEMTTHGDSSYIVLSTDRSVTTSAVLTAPRTWTLPAANAVNAGQHLLIADRAGGIGGANVLSITRAGSDTINGGATVKLTSAYSSLDLVSDGTSIWTTTTLPGDVITPWVAYVPTYTGFGSATNLGTWSRRNGPDLELKGAFTPGTTTATEARMTLGFAGTNGNVTSAALPVRFTVGTLGFAFAFAGTGALLAEASVGYVTFGLQDASHGDYTKANGSVFISGNSLSFEASIPIEGWN